jgi:hypothetical protein
MTRTRSPSIFLALVAGTLVLAGCALPSDRLAADRDAARWIPIEPQRARIDIGRDTGIDALAAREKRTVQGELIEEITLANDTAAPGGNVLTLAVDYGPSSFLLADPYAVKVGQYAMTPTTVAAATRQVFDKAQQVTAPEIRANRYGPYSFITAEYPGVAHCALAWQVVSPDLLPTIPFRKASVRMRVCGRAADTATLLRAFDTFRLAL